jgi:hypothetical protein
MSERKLYDRKMDCGHSKPTSLDYIFGDGLQVPKIGDACYCRECWTDTIVTDVKEITDTETLKSMNLFKESQTPQTKSESSQSYTTCVPEREENSTKANVSKHPSPVENRDISLENKMPSNSLERDFTISKEEYKRQCALLEEGKPKLERLSVFNNEEPIGSHEWIRAYTKESVEKVLSHLLADVKFVEDWFGKNIPQGYGVPNRLYIMRKYIEKRLRNE